MPLGGRGIWHSPVPDNPRLTKLAAAVRISICYSGGDSYIMHAEPKMTKNRSRVQVSFIVLLLMGFSCGSAVGQGDDQRPALQSRHVAFSSDGQLLACSYGEVKTAGALRIWDWQSGKLLVEHDEAAGICSAAFSPDGRSIAIGMFGPIGKTISLKSGKVLAEFKGHTNHFRAVAYVSDDVLASGSYDKTIRLWNAKNGRELSILGTHEDELRSIAVSPDGRFLASGATSPDCRLFDLTTMQEVGVFRDSQLICPQVRFSSDGRYFLAASWDHKVRIRETTSQRILASIALDSIYGIALSPDDSMLLGQNDSPLVDAVELRLDGPTDTEKAELLRLAKHWSDDEYAVREKASRDVEALGVVVAPLLGRLASMKNTEIRIRARSVRRRLMQNSARKLDVGHEGNLRALNFSPDNIHVATGDTKGVVKVWKYANQEVVKTFQPLAQANTIAKE